MTTDLHPDVVAAIRKLAGTKLGRRYDRWARRRYGVSGGTLAGKTVAGEFGGRSTKTGRGVVSSAGARGPAQFIPSTRKAYMEKYGVDPWAGDKEAIQSMMRHHLSTGVEGYNPGMPTYKDYILGQKLNREDRRAVRGRGGGSMDPGRPPSTDVKLDRYTIPGQSFEAERADARRELLTGDDINLRSLLSYKQKVNALQDIPERRVAGDLQITRDPGQKPRMTTAKGSRAPVARGKVIGTPHTGTHTLGNWQSDNAVDVSMPNGAAVRAAGSGTVVKVAGSYKGGSSRFDGYQVTIKTRNNQVFYTHLKSANVKAGQRVSRGQVIGRSGSANGVPHLHFGVERGDPRRYL